MKLRSIFFTSAALAVGLTTSAFAQGSDVATSMATLGADSSGVLGTVGGELSAGYTTDYIFRGANLGEDAIWTGVEVSVPMTEVVDLAVGAWYINPTSGPFDDEADYYANLSFSMAGFDVGLGYAAYTYPEFGSGTTNEVGLTLAKNLGFITISGGYYYDFDLELSYYEVGLGMEYALTDALTAAISVRGGFIDSDYAHTTIDVEFPIALSDSATFVPHVAGVFPGSDVFGDQDDTIFGGAAIRVSF